VSAALPRGLFAMESDYRLDTSTGAIDGTLSAQAAILKSYADPSLPVDPRVVDVVAAASRA
jgi:hypothetical protein